MPSYVNLAHLSQLNDSFPEQLSKLGAKRGYLYRNAANSIVIFEKGTASKKHSKIDFLSIVNGIKYELDHSQSTKDKLDQYKISAQTIEEMRIRKEKRILSKYACVNCLRKLFSEFANKIKIGKAETSDTIAKDVVKELNRRIKESTPTVVNEVKSSEPKNPTPEEQPKATEPTLPAFKPMVIQEIIKKIKETSSDDELKLILAPIAAYKFEGTEETLLHLLSTLVSKGELPEELCLRLISLLSELKADFNAKDQSGHTPLFALCMNQGEIKKDILEKLLKCGANPSVGFKEYPNLLWYVVLENEYNSEFIELIIKHMDTAELNKQVDRPYKMNAPKDDFKKLGKLSGNNYLEINKYTLLHYAIWHKNNNLVSFLKGYNVDLRIKDSQGNVPLHYLTFFASKFEELFILLYPTNYGDEPLYIPNRHGITPRYFINYRNNYQVTLDIKNLTPQLKELVAGLAIIEFKFDPNFKNKNVQFNKNVKKLTLSLYYTDIPEFGMALFDKMQLAKKPPFATNLFGVTPRDGNNIIHEIVLFLRNIEKTRSLSLEEQVWWINIIKTLGSKAKEHSKELFNAQNFAGYTPLHAALENNIEGYVGLPKITWLTKILIDQGSNTDIVTWGNMGEWRAKLALD